MCDLAVRLLETKRKHFIKQTQKAVFKPSWLDLRKDMQVQVQQRRKPNYISDVSFSFVMSPTPRMFLHALYQPKHAVNKIQWNTNNINLTFCWPCIMQWFLVIVQLDAQIPSNIFIYSSLHVSSISCSSSGETDCINTPNQYTTLPSTRSDIYQKLYWYNLFLLMMSMTCSKHVENYK